MTGCPSDAEIDAFLNGGVSKAEIARIQSHVDGCTQCRVLIGKLAQMASTTAPEYAPTLAPTPTGLDETMAAPSITSGPRALPGAAFPTARDSPLSIPPPMADRVDRYKIKKKLGAGGMGIVYVATDPELGRDVAIKVLKRGAEAERLRREAQALARLDHPNVVAVYDVGEHDGGVFVAMALVDGVNLRDWLVKEHTTDEILAVLVQAARGIIAAHDAGMIHRDLKPDNIFVANDGKVLVGDFGLAREATSSDGRVIPKVTAADSLTQTGSVLGTPAYMAPEQAAGEATEASDQFSFCVTAYEAFYGTRPFVGNTLEDLMDKVESGTIAKPRRDRRVPDHVRRAIRRGLSADPSARFPSMAALIAAFQPRARRWPWIAGALGAIAIGSTVFVVTREDATDCSVTKRALDEVWNTKRKDTLATALVKHLVEKDVASEISKALDAHASRWTAVRHATCTDKNIDAQVRCLDVNRVYFEQLITSMIDAKDYIDPASLWRRVASLPAPETCRGAEVEKLASGGPEHLALMRDVAGAVSTQTNLDVYARLRARAESKNDLPAQLAIALAESSRALEVRNTVQADAALARALTLAETLDIPAFRVRALAMSARSKCQQNADASVALDMAGAASKRLREDHHALEIDELLDARALCTFKAGKYAEAAGHYEKLVGRLVGRYGKDDLLQLEPRSTLAMIYHQLGKPDAAVKEEAEVARLITKFGGDSSAAAMSASIAASNAFQAGDIREAIAHQRRASDLWALEGEARVLKVQSLEQLAMFHEVDGAWRAAIDTHGEVLALFDQPQTVPSNELMRIKAMTFRGAVRVNVGELDAAVADLERALELARARDETELLAVAQFALGRLSIARKDYKRGAQLINDGLATHAKLGKDIASFRVGVARFALAQAEWELGDKPAARETVRRAERDIAQGVDDVKKLAVAKNQIPWREAKLDEVTKWRDSHR